METKNASASGDNALALALDARAGTLAAGWFAVEREEGRRRWVTYGSTRYQSEGVFSRLGMSAQVEVRMREPGEGVGESVVTKGSAFSGG